ncbi:unnamed protein product [Paramecium sonneborni]|uniref:Uncharacterized protein n=1 Tax=Paramecium sonneborni TaxID=65129 RepID=A0A8S1LY97_9CILI|nr:unnamed protein product [Paramecium sonneborni]
MGAKCSNSMIIKDFDVDLEESLYIQTRDKKETQIGNNDLKKNKIFENQCIIWNDLKQRWMNTKILIAFTQNFEIIYLKDGQILRIEKVKDISQKPDTLTNFEQIKFLEWFGKFEINHFKVGKWTANWNGEKLMEVGGYYSKDGLKQGIWKELIKNYWTGAQVYEIGVYINNQRRGFWNYLYGNNKIPIGQYNDQGQKDGKWIVLSPQFCNISQVTYHGEYKNGRKVGKWDTFFLRNGKNQWIGGRSYEDQPEMKTQMIQLRVGSGQNQAKGFRIKKSKMEKVRKFVVKFGMFQEIFFRKAQEQLQKCKILCFKKHIFIIPFLNQNYFHYFQLQILMGAKCSNSMIIKDFDVDLEESLYIQTRDKKETQIGNNDLKKNKIFENQCIIWNDLKQRWMNTKILIAFTQNFEIIYLKDGQILRIEKVKDISQKPDTLTNFEQIKFLEWFGKFEINHFKVGKWTANWNGEKLMEVGGYYSKDGLKQGIWKELIKNYWTGAQVYEIGVYINNQRRGFWNYLYGNNKIPIGQYNDQGQKDGKWIVLSPQFCNWKMGYFFSQKWKKSMDVIFEIQYFYVFLRNSGGGVYQELKVADQKQDSIKNGKWIEEQDGYYDKSQMIFVGEYKNGKKFGFWDTIYVVYSREYPHFNDKWGGGKYQNSIKTGNWVELCNFFYQDCWVTYEGEYKNGLKVGQWDIKLERNKFGGGQYDFQNDNDNIESSFKTGQWIEEADDFFTYSNVIHQGYYKDGKKVGRWNIISKGEVELTGGGSYQEKLRDHAVEDSVKIGKWVEFCEQFQMYNQIYTTGQYDNNGCKFGNWDIFCNFTCLFRDKKKIGGGLYVQNDNVGYIKTGKWIELSNEYFEFNQITYHGEYNNGRKVGRWDTFLTQNEKAELIGGGQYYEQPGDEIVLGSIKIGKWIEIDEYSLSNLVIFVGNYKNNQKVGLWNEMMKNKDGINLEFIKMKEIQYEKE